MGTGRNILAPWEPPYQAGELTTGISEVGVTFGDSIARRNVQIARTLGSGVIVFANRGPETDRKIADAIDLVPLRSIDQL